MVLYRQRRIGRDGQPFDMLKLRTMVDGAEHIGAGLAVNENDARITRVGRAAAADLAGRAPEPAERAARGDVADRPAPDAAGAGRAVHRAPARAPCDPARDHGLGAGQRPRVAAVERSGSSSTCYYIEHRSLALDLQILWRTPAMVLGGGGSLQGADRGLGRVSEQGLSGKPVRSEPRRSC